MKGKTVVLTQFAILLALEALVCFTPLGSLPAIGPIVATLMMLPVIMTGLALGAGAGALMGFLAGLFSFLIWTYMPPLPIIAFVFTPFYGIGGMGGSLWSLVVCFVPRTLGGLMAGLLTGALHHKSQYGLIKYGVPAFVGSLCNTLGVLGFIWLFFGNAYADALGMGYAAMVGALGLTVLTSGIPEAIIAVVVCSAAIKAVKTANLIK